MKNKNIFIITGFVIYSLLTIVDKLISKVPDITYIVISLIAFVLIVIGTVKNKKH